MSFQGHYQTLCANGHLNVYGAHVAPDFNQAVQCMYCEGYIVWWNLVDDTNGLGHNEVRLKRAKTLNESLKTKTCGHCGHTVLVPEVYDIPKAKGHKVPKTLYQIFKEEEEEAREGTQGLGTHKPPGLSTP